MPKKPASTSSTTTPVSRDVHEADVEELLNKPHTITAMLIGGALLVYFAFTRDETVATVSNVKSGLAAICLVFLLFSMLQMRDGLFRRPHPAFWRIVMGFSVLYLCALVFLIFQSVDDARQMLRYLDPKLGIKLPERNYAEHCELYTPEQAKEGVLTSHFQNLWDTVNDEFIWAHLIGWWGKTILLRDASLCWVISILFEIWEMTFEFMLPNFKECWWDHIILDIIVCNGLGIYLGLLTCRYLKMKEYDWAGMQTTPQRKGWRKLVQQLTPFSYDEYNWEMLKDYKRFMSVCIVIGMFSVVELNAFFLKYLLWIPPPHPINIYRLLLWVFIGMAGLREYYQFATDSNNKRFGTMAWLSCATAGMEVLICLKFAPGEFTQPAPPEVKYSWLAFIVVFVVGSFIFFNRKKTPENTPNHTKTKKVQ